VPVIVAEQPQPTSPPATGSVEQIVREAARKYGIDETYFVKNAMCESTMTPSKVNYQYWEDSQGTALGVVGERFYPSGMIQHVTKYWPARAAKYGYAGARVFDAEANANVTAGMFRDGARNLWECK
jgi:hypothetical protein